MNLKDYLKKNFPPFKSIGKVPDVELEEQLPANVTIIYKYTCGHELVSHAYMPGKDQETTPRESTETIPKPCPDCRRLKGWKGSGYDPKKELAEAITDHIADPLHHKRYQDPPKIKVKTKERDSAGPVISSPTRAVSPAPCSHSYDTTKWSFCPRCYQEGKR
jgi:hypothetical protein